MSIILVGTSLPFEWDNLSPLVRIEFTNLPKFGEDQSSRPASYVPSALPELGLSALGLCSAVAAYLQASSRARWAASEASYTSCSQRTNA